MGPLPMRVEWRFVPMGHMAQCVMTGGMNLMPESSADNWDMLLMVRSSHGSELMQYYVLSQMWFL